MATTPSSLQVVKEVETSTIGDAAPTPAAGSLEIFANQNDTFYKKTSAGVVSPLIPGVDSFNGRIGAVLPIQADYDSFFLTPAEGNAAYDALGLAAAAQAASQPVDATLTALAGQNWALNSTPRATGADTMVQQAIAANQFMARASTGDYVPKAVTDAVLAWLATPTGANAAVLGINAMTGWIDVTLQATPVLTANTGAQNITAINAILAAAANGSTIYIPKGTYLFNAAWTMPSNKMFVFQGQGANRAGSPATAYTELRWNANVGGDIITLPGSGGGWYTQFRNLTFTAITVDQSAGAVININGNVGTNIIDCAFQSAGTFFNNVLVGEGGNGSNSWNSAVISNCNIQGFKGVGIRVNSSGSSLVIENTVIQGNWGGFTGTPAANAAAACVSGGFVGALQVMASDFLGAVNCMLLNPVTASSEVCASVFVTNTYMDNSAGSCLKIMGTGPTVRARFTTCSFTTAGTNYSVGGTGLSAVEITSTYGSFAAGGQAVAFTDCNIFNTFGTVGTTNGFLINNNWADVYMNGCAVAGWTNGYNVTPTGTNISLLKVTGGACGPSGGYGANTTGFNIAAGSYKGLEIQAVNAHGNTTNLTLGAVTVAAADASLFRITDNTGINPRGAITPPIGTPVSGTTYTNATGFKCHVECAFATTFTAFAINGVAYGANIPTTGKRSIQLDPGSTIAMTGTGAASWVWSAM